MWRLLPVVALALMTTLTRDQDKAGPGMINSVAGTGQKGFSGDGGRASTALLDNPFHCDLNTR